MPQVEWIKTRSRPEWAGARGLAAGRGSEGDADGCGEDQLRQGGRDQHQPAEPLELVLAQPGVRHPNQMITKLTAATLSRVHSQPSCASANGPCQPPRNSTVVSAAITTMPTYSASRRNAKRRPVYSVR